MPAATEDAVAMLDHPWNIVFLVGLVTYIGIRHVFAARTVGEEKAESRVDVREKVMLTMVILGSLLAPVLYLFTPALGFADYELPSYVPWIGLPVLMVALWLFWRSHVDLGLNWSISLELRHGHRLVDTGVYRRIRHPMYTSILLWSIAQGLLLENWFAGWAALATFIPLYIVRTPREESMMCEALGDEYREYMSRTGRLWPSKGPSDPRAGD